MDNYFVFVDFKFQGIDGSCVECIFEFVGVVVNKNIVFGDCFVFVFGGFCMGIFVMIICGFIENDFVCVVDVVDCVVIIVFCIDKVVCKIVEEVGEKSFGKLKFFMEYFGNGESYLEIVQLRSEVEDWVGMYFFLWELGK